MFKDFSRVLFLTIALFFFFPWSGAVSAQEHIVPGGLFIVQPAKTELRVYPGEEKMATVTLSNGTDAPLNVSVSFEDFRAEPQQSSLDDPIQLLGDARGERSLLGMLAVPKKSFDVLSGRSVSVPIEVDIPRGTEPGGRYGAVVFTFKPALAGEAQNGANIAFEQRIATLFYVRVEGAVREEGALSAFGVFNNERFVPAPQPERPLRFQVAYENTGTVHLDPYGRITLTSLWGTKETVVVEPWAVLPGATRMLEVDLFSTLYPGFYRAHLELNRGYGNIVDEKEVSFWVVPSLMQMLLFVVMLAVLATILWRSFRLSRHFLK